MAYVALAPAPRATRLAQGDARWNRLAAAHPDLAQAATLQRALVAVALDLLDDLEDGHLPRLSLPPGYLAEKLKRGVPALTAEPIPIPISILSPGLQRYSEVLAAGGAGPAAANIGKTLDEGRIDPGSLLTASLNRDQKIIRQGAEHLGLAPDLLWLIAELGVSPFVHALQTRVFARMNPSLAAALDAWSAGYCPACGSWPAVAELVAGLPVLRCSFCSLAWALPPDRCVYCRAEPPAFRTLSSPDDRPRSLQVCDSCRGYLKVVPLDALSPFPLVAVSDLESTSLDIDAMHRGYQRPQLPQTK